MTDLKPGMGRDIHIVRNKERTGFNDKWIAVQGRASNHLAIGSTQMKCLRAVRGEAKRRECKVKIHGMDGKVRKTVSYE